LYFEVKHERPAGVTSQATIHTLYSSRRFFDLATASELCLHRSVPPPPAGLAGVGRGREPDLWMEISIKIIFFKDYVSVLVVIFVSSKSMEMSSFIISDL
jgi:hypothetical protein